MIFRLISDQLYTISFFFPTFLDFHIFNPLATAERSIATYTENGGILRQRALK